MESEQPKTSDNTPLKLFIAQVNALFKKHMLICFRNKSSLLKELLLPMITSVSIYTSQFSQDVTMPIQILFPISLMGHVRSFMVDIVHEKSEKYREYLKINGVSSLAYIFSMLLFGYLKALIFTIVTCSSFVFIGTKTFELEVSSVLILYFLTAIACTHFALLITAFFSSKQLCSDVGGFIFTILSFLFVIAFETGSKVWYYISLIFPQNGLAYALFNPVQNKISINAGELIAIATLDAIVFLVVFLYLDQILPDVYGVRKSPFFCIRLCYRRRSKSIPVQAPVIVTEQRSFMETDFAEGGLTTRRDLFSMEQVEEDDISSASYHQKFENPAELKRTIFLENISKSFGHEKIIDDLSLMIYERQIFCLLGHNGAGKTTTINLLTGLLDYKNGEIHYQDLPFRDNMSSIRKTLGLCGQQDILYPDLTVEEHMQMMGQIRGDSGSKLNLEIQATMHRIGLEAERTKLVKTLSGGNKRKLSLGLAVLGDVRIVFLDEPTSGMDPNTRRSVWNLIKGLRDEGKTIVLTTHHLDEADELSDRIGVMSKGKLFAVGSSDFIKRKFGVGYHLIITPDYERNCTIEHFESLQPRIFDIVHQFIESANQEDQGTSAIIKFMLPFTYQKSFPQMFEELEKINNIKLNLKMNSLEDAFINIGMHDDLHFEQGSRADANQTNMNVEPPQTVKEHTPKYIFMYQLEAMFLRKYFFTVRNYKNIVLIISPIIFVILGTMATVWRLRSLEDNETEQRQGDDLDHSHDRINQGKNDQGGHGSFESTTSSAQSTLQLIEGLIIMMFLFFVNFAYSFNATVYCVFPVYERENKIAYSLRVMGCRDHPYWLGTFTFDFLAIQLINVTLVMLVYIFEIKYLQDDIPLFIATVMSYSSALITTSYFWGFVFQNSNTVFKSYAAFYLFALYCLPSAVLSLLSYYGQAPSFSNAVAILIFHICPNFAFNDSVKLSLGQSAFFLKSRQQCVIWLLWLTFFYVIGAILIQKKRFKVSISQTRALQDINPEYSPSIDFSEMASEANRIRNPENQDPLKIQNLNKTYKNGFKAIKDLSFGIKNKEIFGLLGPNGAGKSTTFHISTAMIPRSGGNIELNAQSIDGKLDKLFGDIGVCPQFDALWDDLKVDEHLFLYCKVKGIGKLERTEAIEYILDALKLSEHRGKKVKELSGGTKRKLSTAIALIGSPSLKFLDEPSTGIDPLAKRFLWSCIRNSASAKDGSTMLTTHSMEEAEALCHRIGIIVNGKFVCIGPLEYLKDKYGSGYKVTVVRTTDMEEVGGFINDIFPDAKKIQDGSTTTETYQIIGQSFRFSRALRALEGLKRGGAIKDFSIYNTTLEQVFINFSKEQQEPSSNILIQNSLN